MLLFPMLLPIKRNLLQLLRLHIHLKSQLKGFKLRQKGPPILISPLLHFLVMSLESLCNKFSWLNSLNFSLWFHDCLFQLFQYFLLPLFLYSPMAFLLGLRYHCVVAVLDHMFVSGVIEEFRDEGPFFSMLHHSFKEQKVLLLAPRLFLKVRVDMVNPLFPTFFPWPEKLASRSHQQHVWNLTPLKRVPELPSLDIKYPIIPLKMSFSS